MPSRCPWNASADAGVSLAGDVVSGESPQRTGDRGRTVRRVIDPDRWRVRADGPRWLYAEPGRLRAAWRLLAFGLALLVIQPIVESLVAPMFGLLSSAVGEPVPAYPWITLLAVMAALTLALRVVDDAPWSTVALTGSGWQVGRLFTGLGVGAAAIAATMALLWITATVRIEPWALMPGAAPNGMDAWIATSLRLAALLAPAALWEELVFRGYLWGVAEQAAGVRLARWTTAIAFGLVHVLNPGASVLSTLLVTVAGLCLGTLRERTGSLPAVWLAHFAWNWIMAAVLHVPVSGAGFETPGYRTTISGPQWWTGGEWGPEGGGAALFVLGGAFVLARPWTDRRFADSRLLRTGSDSR
jgi:uncharacterized protein